MLNIEKSTGSRSAFRTLLSQSGVGHPPPGSEIFTLEGNSSRVSSAGTSPIGDGMIGLAFAPLEIDESLPDRTGRFSDAERDNILCLLASPDGRFGSLRILAAAKIYTSLLGSGHQINYRIEPDHHVWLRPARGKITVNGKQVCAGEIMTASDEKEIVVSALSDSEFLLVVMP